MRAAGEAPRARCSHPSPALAPASHLCQRGIPASQVPTDDVILSSYAAGTQEVAAEIEIGSAGEELTLLASTYAPDVQAAFTLTLYRCGPHARQL